VPTSPENQTYFTLKVIIKRVENIKGIKQTAVERRAKGCHDFRLSLSLSRIQMTSKKKSYGAGKGKRKNFSTF
jgi:hypothetical protein